MSPCKEGFEIVQSIMKVKWIPEILLSLDTGNHHFNEILKSIPYLSHTELNRKLKHLMLHNIITKNQKTEREYILMPLGSDLLHIIRNFEGLVTTHNSFSQEQLQSGTYSES